MQSILTSIYAQLAAMAVTYTDRDGAQATPTVYSLASIPGSVQTAHLPCRLLLPLGQGGGNNSAQVLSGSGALCSWSVTDLFLLEAAAQDSGLYVQAPVVVDYCAKYARAIGQLYRFLSAPQVNTATISAQITPGMYEYPTGSGAVFYGVRVQISIEELI